MKDILESTLGEGVSAEELNKLNKMFRVVAGSDYARCTCINIKGFKLGNTSGVSINEASEEMTYHLLMDSLTVLRKSGNSVYSDNAATVGSMVNGIEYVIGEPDLVKDSCVDGEKGESTKQEEINKGEGDGVGVDNEEVEVENTSKGYKNPKENPKVRRYYSFIKNKINDLMLSYKSLYEVCYKNSRPKGILTPEGIYTLSGKEMKLKPLDFESQAELEAIYSVITGVVGEIDCTQRFNNSTPPSDIVACSGIPMFVRYHLANMYGYFDSTNSQKETSYEVFDKYMRKKLGDILFNMLGEQDEDLLDDNEKIMGLVLQYIASIKNCIIVDEYKQGTVLKLRICMDSVAYPAYSGLGINSFSNSINSGMVFTQGTSIESSTIDLPGGKENDVLYINFVVDANKYYNEPLFAYEMIPLLQETGEKLSWGHLLLGKDTKDSLVYGDFSDTAKTIYNLIAGSGSGKGVMTLSILASALSANMFGLYADCKPDMAKVLWEVSGGQNVMAFDGDASGVLEAIEKKMNIFEYLNYVPEAFQSFVLRKGIVQLLVKTLSYIKVMQLSNLITLQRANKGIESPDDNILFIFDEIGKLGGFVKELNEYIDEFIKERKNELGTKEAKTDDAVKYAEAVKKYPIEVVSKLRAYSTAEMRLSHSKYLFIWQPDWITTASLGKITSSENPYFFLATIYKLLCNNSVKFAGKGAENTGPLLLNEAARESTRQFFEYRYFALEDAGGSATIGEKSTIFRPFLLLNKGNEHYASQTVTNNPLAQDKVYDENGNVIPEIGFPEYVEKLFGGSVTTPLCASWGMAMEALEAVGVEPDIFKFVYDISNLNPNLGGKDSFDSRDGDTYERKESFSEKVQKEGSGYENIDDIESAETERMSVLFDDENVSNLDEDMGDIFEDEITLIESQLDVGMHEGYNFGGEENEFTTQVREIDDLINQLKNAGIGVSVNSHGVDIDLESVQRGKSRAEIDLGNVDFHNPKMSLQELSQRVTDSVSKNFGGEERFKSFGVKGGAIAVNNTFYRSKISKGIVQGMPYDIQQQINSGNVAILYDFTRLQNMINLRVLSIDSNDLWFDYIQPVFGNNIENAIVTLYRVCPNLQDVIICGTSYNPNNLSEVLGVDNVFERKSKANDISRCIQQNCFKGAGASWRYAGDSIRNNKKWYTKALGAGAGVTGAAIAGSAGVATTVARGVGKFAKGFASGMKNLMKE